MVDNKNINKNSINSDSNNQIFYDIFKTMFFYYKRGSDPYKLLPFLRVSDPTHNLLHLILYSFAWVVLLRGF